MKNLFKTLVIITTFLTVGTMQVFATNVEMVEDIESTDIVETSDNMESNESLQIIDNMEITDRADYMVRAKAIRSEIETITNQIKLLKEYNANVNAKLKDLNEKYKTDKSSISSDTMKQVKELRRSLQDIEKREKTVTEDTTIKSLIQNKEYDKAIARLNEILTAKKAQLKVVQDRNAIWRQIDALIG